jgi:hypothetical protein
LEYDGEANSWPLESPAETQIRSMKLSLEG